MTMGLLTDQKSRDRLSSLLKKWNRLLCVVLYFGGAIGFLAVSYQPLNNKTYFSENALLAGLVDNVFDKTDEARNYYKDFKEQVKLNKTVLPVDWLYKEMAMLGLDVFVQNFTYTYPLNLLEGKKMPGTNVYGILRAPKAASTEALVISVPYRLPEDPRPSTNAGVALMLSLAKYFRGQTYWAKDIIFLVTQHEEIGIQAWLDAYHGDKNQFIRTSGLEGRGGSIQAAINLELYSSNIDYMDIKINGLNGKLPNLDLVNVAVHMCEKERIKSSLHNQFDHYSPFSEDGIYQSLKTYVLQIWTQLSNTPTGNHGLFHKYRIEAVTLAGVRTKDGKHERGFASQGKAVEGIIRSLNNLLERFHQSFFFYLLPATHRYVSIGVYTAPFGAMAAAVLIQALAIWVEVTEEEEMKEEKENQTTARKLDGLFQKPKLSSFTSAIPPFLMTQIFGIAAYFGPNFFMWASTFLELPPDDALALGCVALGISAISFPYMLRKKAENKGIRDGEYRMLKCVALIYQGLILFALSVMNISLAYCLALFTVPVSLITRPVKNFVARVILISLLLLTSPLALLFGCAVAQTMMTKNVTDINKLGLESWNQMKDIVLWGIVDWYLFANWIYQVLALAVFPNWLMFWAILWKT